MTTNIITVFIEKEEKVVFLTVSQHKLNKNNAYTNALKCQNTDSFTRIVTLFKIAESSTSDFNFRNI